MEVFNVFSRVQRNTSFLWMILWPIEFVMIYTCLTINLLKLQKIIFVLISICGLPQRCRNSSPMI